MLEVLNIFSNDPSCPSVTFSVGQLAVIILLDCLMVCRLVGLSVIIAKRAVNNSYNWPHVIRLLTNF